MGFKYNGTILFVKKYEPLSSLKGFSQRAEAKQTDCHGFAEAEIFW